MITHKNDGTYIVLDPMLKDGLRTTYFELSGCLVYTSKGGWLIAEGPSHIMLFLDPFTKQRINLPHLFGGAYGVAFSCSSMSKGLQLFFVSEVYNEPSVEISVHQCGDNKWTTREFENNFPFQLNFSSPIFMKGCFYCWGGMDALGFTIQ